MEKSNIWTRFLSESSKKTTVPEAVCLLLGDNNVHKKTVIKAMYEVEATATVTATTTMGVVGRDQISNTADVNEDSSFLSYNYLDVEDKHFESIVKLHFWCFEQLLFHDSLPLLKISNGLQKMIIMITLDLSDPDQCITILKTWLLKVHVFLKDRHEQSKSNEAIVSIDSSGDKESNSRQLVSYLKHIRLHKGDMRSIFTTQATLSPSAVDGDVISDELRFILDHFNIPIIVIGSNSEHIMLDSNASIRKHRELQGSIRSICMDIGAALIYTGSPSIHPTLQSTAIANSNNNVLRRYIIHRLYPELVPMELSIDDRLEVTFIPSGFDTIDLINIQCGLKLVSREYAKSFIVDLTKSIQSLTTLTLKPNDEASNSNISSEFKELESEQQWLDGLSQFISQLSLNGASSSTNLATTSSMKLNSSSLSLNSLESQSFTSSDANTNINNIISSTNTNTVTKEGALSNDPNKPPPPVVSRRASVRSSSIATEKKDVGDFFKNLLKK